MFIVRQINLIKVIEAYYGAFSKILFFGSFLGTLFSVFESLYTMINIPFFVGF